MHILDYDLGYHLYRAVERTSSSPIRRSSTGHEDLIDVLPVRAGAACSTSFGASKIRAGGEMISVATGLALRSQAE